MRFLHRGVLLLALALAFPLGAGCSGGAIESSGTGGAPDPSTGDFPQGADAVGVGVSTGGVLLPPGIWTNVYGDAEDQHAAAVAVNDAGETALTGTALGTIDFGNIPWKGSTTDTDVVVAKLSSEGQSLWSRRYGDSCDQHGGAVALTPSGNVLIAGDFCGKMDFGTTTVETKGTEVDLFVAVLDTLGEDIYSRRFGGKGAQIARAAAVDADGNAIIVGSFDQAFDDGSGELATAGLDDAFVIKLDPKGTLLWSLTFGGPESDLPRSVAVGPDRNIVVGGSFGGSVDFGGGPIAASAGHSSGFVLEIDPDGKHLWSKSLGAEADADTVVNGVAVSVKGTVAATGAYAGTADFGSGPAMSVGAEDVFVAAMDSTGTSLWGYTFGGPKSQRAIGAAFGPTGEVVISGVSDETIDFAALSPDASLVLNASYPMRSDMVYALELDAFGTPRIAWVLDSLDAMECVGVGLDKKGGVVLAGSFQKTLSFRFGGFSSAGGWDMFAMREQQ